MPARPNPLAVVEQAGDDVGCRLDSQRDRWSEGHTRRTFIRGAGLAGVAALGSQLVTTKAAYAAKPSRTAKTVVVVSLRGAADGLRMLVPASQSLGADYLRSVRPALYPDRLLPLSGSGGWALNDALAPLQRYWGSGELSFVPAVSTRGVTRSHFQAQQYLDTGGESSSSSGWLDRLLTQLGPGTTFRAVGEGSEAPGPFVGSHRKLLISALSELSLPTSIHAETRTAEAIAGLYRGMPGAMAATISETLTALRLAAPLRRAVPAHGARYSQGGFGSALRDLATLLRAEVGLQVAAVDVGGWDTHTSEVSNLDGQLGSLAKALDSFMQDLGPARRSRVTVVVCTEFGRRVAQNGSGGTDHGHGAVMMLLGGGLRRQHVAGKWTALGEHSLDQGDVPGLNDPFQVFAEVAASRLRATSSAALFPGLRYSPVGVMQRN